MKIKGVLNVQTERGVVYFHDERGECLLRIEGLPIPLPDPYKKQLDVRHMKGVGWMAKDGIGTVMNSIGQPEGDNRIPPSPK